MHHINVVKLNLKYPCNYLNYINYVTILDHISKHTLVVLQHSICRHSKNTNPWKRQWWKYCITNSIGRLKTSNSFSLLNIFFLPSKVSEVRMSSNGNNKVLFILLWHVKILNSLMLSHIKIDVPKTNLISKDALKQYASAKE